MKFPIALLILLCASPVSAGPIDAALIAFAAVGQFADQKSSLDFSHSSGCSESNPALRNADGTYDARRGGLLKGAIVTAGAGLLLYAAHVHSRPGIIAARILNIATGTLGATAGISNWRSCK